MGDLEQDGRGLAVRQQYEALLAVSKAIVGHRDPGTLFQELAGHLQLVVRFDFLALVLLDAGSNTTRSTMSTARPGEEGSQSDQVDEGEVQTMTE